MELQSAVCVEKKTKPVVPNKIGECENWFLSSFQQVQAHSTSCWGQAPVGLKSVTAGRGLCSFPSGGVPICQVHSESGTRLAPPQKAGHLLACATFQGAQQLVRFYSEWTLLFHGGFYCLPHFGQSSLSLLGILKTL